jgi:hypothetical protein
MSDRLPTKQRCPLCGIGDTDALDGLTKARFLCRVCGAFEVSHRLLEDIDFQSSQSHPYLSAATRKAYDAGRMLLLNPKEWRELEEGQRSIRITEKLNDLLRLVAKRSDGPGGSCDIRDGIDYPLIAAAGPGEFRAYLDHFRDQGILKRLEHNPNDPDRGLYALTVPGWERLEPMPLPGGVPGRCFVAMSFDLSLESAYALGIKPAILECGFTPVCMKEIATNEGITDRILSEIRLAQFVVADFTGQRGGVYFEAGFARGLGREVIWSCRKDELHRVHFDINHFGHVVWETPVELQQKLAESIRANILPKQ